MKPWCQLTVSAVALVAGGLIYIAARPPHLLLFWLIRQAGLQGMADAIRSALPMEGWPEWAVYSLPGGLWALSYVLVMDVLTRHLPARAALLLCGVVPMAGVVSELLQRAYWLPGTYDGADLAFYLTPYALYLFTRLYNHRRHQHEQEHQW